MGKAVGKSKAGTKSAAKPYHHGNLRDELMAAALELIQEGGVQALSLRAAARKAGVSAAAPYHHFKDREELLAAIAEDGFRRLSEMMQTAAEKGQKEAAARKDESRGWMNCGYAYIDFARSYPAHFSMMFRPELVDHDEHSSLKEASTESFGALVEQVLAMQQNGLAPSGEWQPWVLLSWAAAHGVATLTADGPLGKDGMAEEKFGMPAEAAGPMVIEALRRLFMGDGAPMPSDPGTRSREIRDANPIEPPSDAAAE